MAGKPEIVQPQRILLVTGMLGAGKTTALHELEDLGWEAIDNFPIRLLQRLVGNDTQQHPLAIGFEHSAEGRTGRRFRGFARGHREIVPIRVLVGR